MQWTRINSYEQRLGDYTVVDEPSVPEVWVFKSGQMVWEGDSVKEARRWCEDQLGIFGRASATSALPPGIQPPQLPRPQQR
ncbi:hypothetical protein ACFOM8_05875 [Paracoccus angustae]|uniref:Uncharacterized protein n=1 Tax=Paracoccus angustae TaxID=1671480 RepID=A0ABV7U212_9RHOB